MTTRWKPALTVVGLSWALGMPVAWAQRPAPANGAPAAPTALPAEVEAALVRARVPADAVAVLVQEAGRGSEARTLLAHQPRAPMNPASLIKLLTTYAALDTLGPAWSWSTGAWVLGTPREGGVFEGDLILRGSGDPKLVIERLWLLLKRIQALGVRELRGDIVLDRSAFAPAPAPAGDFDGESSRPYNVQPDALLLNFKAITYSFVPEPARGVARIVAEPELNPRAERSVALASGACDDWRGALKAVVSEGGFRFTGRYPAACGEQHWPLADPDPASYAQRLVGTLWRELGGSFSGRVRDGSLPANARLLAEQRSPPLAEVVRDINKFSNNVMAQQLALTLALQLSPGQPASAEGAREVLRRFAVERLGESADDWVLDNGSGLSRTTRVNAAGLARLLQHAQASPLWPELASSLPVSGTDGTLRRARALPGRAHLKTGSLRDAAGVAGYVLADSGRRLVLVVMINHPNANAARPAIEALVQWAMRQG